MKACALLPMLLVLRGFLAQATGDCFDNCTRLVVDDGFVVEGGKRTFVGRKWSSIQKLLSERMQPVNPHLPGLDANSSTMRRLSLKGNYLADQPLSLPSRIHFHDPSSS